MNEDKNIQTKAFHFFTPITKSWTEVVKSDDGLEKDLRFFEVTVSGVKEDRDGESMDKEAIEDMVTQFKSGTIPFFPNHGRDDITGERAYKWQDIMGKWVDARIEGTDLKAVAQLNDANPNANLFWSYIQSGVPLGFSIGGKPEAWVDE